MGSRSRSSAFFQFGPLGPFSFSGQLCPLRGQAPGNFHGQTCIQRGAFCRFSTCLTHGKCIEEPFWFYPTSRSFSVSEGPIYQL
ncbi:hypothetical protein H671_6g16225 [Cricetulus griseus]|nr:hypothetical protein H671_6g16225 [Cricetulus griseus]